jgi:hypothetical protein
MLKPAMAVIVKWPEGGVEFCQYFYLIILNHLLRIGGGACSTHEEVRNVYRFWV